MEAVLRDRHGRVEVITINRPDARNAVNGEVSRGISSALDQVENDDGVGAVILTGSGDRAFSAGMDLKAFVSGEADQIMGQAGGFAGITQRFFSKPIIAAVNGPALAGGFEIMLACDLVVAADHAKFGVPEVKRGLLAGAGALVRLPKRVPLALALELALTGEPIDAHRALELGLINRVVPLDRLLDEALALAETIAANAPLAIRYSKQLICQAADTNEAEGWKLNDEAVGIVFSSEDAQEGPMAFAEKRPPKWKGK